MLLLAMATGACALRDRSNPLDPKNRSTLGGLPGFNAIAGDGVVQLSWRPLTQEGVERYRVDRWSPGETPRPLPGAVFPPHAAAAEDLTPHNDSTYLYRLVALLASGDSAMSPPDTVTPGARRTMVMVADLPGLVGLSADARDVLFAHATDEPYQDLEVDTTRGIFWLVQDERGLISSRTFEGTTSRPELTLSGPSDLTVTTQRGTAWIALPEGRRVARYEPNADSLLAPITGVGTPRIVEGNSRSGTVWVGSDLSAGTVGAVYQASAATSDTLQSWHFDGRIVAIAVDEAIDVAWVAVRTGSLSALYQAVPGRRDPDLILGQLLNVTDLEVEPVDRTLWVSERGAPLTGNGRVTRIGRAGEVFATVAGIEPYALAVEPGTRDCWVTDIKSDRLLLVSAGGAILRRSPPLGVPYGVRIHRP